MKIAVDARPLSKPLNGIGRYTYELLRRIVNSDDEWHLYVFENVKCDFFEKNNVYIHTIPFSKHNQAIANVSTQLIFPIWAKYHKVDIFWSPRHHLPLLLAKSIIPIVSIHDLVWLKVGWSMSWLGRFQERLLMPPTLKKAQEIMAASYSTAKDLYDCMSVDLSRISVITPASTVISKLKLEDVIPFLERIDNFFLFVGTQEPRKNLSNLLKAYASLDHTVRNKARFVIVGGYGWGDFCLNDEIIKLGLSEQVLVLGVIDDCLLASLYSQALFLAMPSFYEGFGMPLVEAMSHGTPVLTSDNSSMPEVAGNAGLLVDALDVESIADGLQEMITNNELRERLAKNAKLNASRYSWDESAKKLITVFEKAIDLRKDKLA